MTTDRTFGMVELDPRRRTMKGIRPIGALTVAMVACVVLTLGVIAGAILGHLQSPPAAARGSSDYVYLSVAFNPYTGLDEFFPANFTVPANVPVVVTITNYDNGTNQVPASFAKVQGTVGGTMTLSNASASNVVVSSVPAFEITHTFTIMTGTMLVNVPIPAAEGAHATSVTFTLEFTQAGAITWMCMAPCDGAAMGTPGFMTGTITVVNN